MSTVSEYFGSMVFDDKVMRSMLSADVYRSMRKTINQGNPLNPEIANAVAQAMKNWAVSKGATHFTHWFQPLNGVTAEKHDSFIQTSPDGGVIMDFSGKELIKGEPDASSFPSGGLRATFEARGYTAWDPTSYAFIRGKTLCIPTAFCSYSGEAMDEKTSLLRSMDALNLQALKVLHILGNDSVKRVHAVVGAEQEYFLVPQDLYEQRPDLRFTGRTLYGVMPPKGQELDDHYFGPIKPEVSSFMEELNIELWKLGVLAKTEHNEVAPSQHELACIYTKVNVTADQNQLVMEMIKRVAERHGFVALLHEKPFDGVNGSGKHNNWSLSTDRGGNLLSPGDTPHDNAQFLLFLCAVIRAVDEFQDLLRISVASASNDHRLGANEAPPAIISIFLGDELTEVLKSIEEDVPYEEHEEVLMKLGTVVLPGFSRDNTDRNRTSPFAFTGNRFEFRAVGSSANCAGSLTVLSAAVAQQFKAFKADVDKAMAAGKPVETAVMDCLKPLIASILDTICFEGNGYSDEWKAEAARRGLDTESSVPKMFCKFTSAEAVELFTGQAICSLRELEARADVRWQTYSTKVLIEARMAARMALNHVLPAGLAYQRKLLENLDLMRQNFPGEYMVMGATQIGLIKECSEIIDSIRSRAGELDRAREKAEALEEAYPKAIAAEKAASALMCLRESIDALEEITDNAIWPLPKYRELLFIS